MGGHFSSAIRSGSESELHCPGSFSARKRFVAITAGLNFVAHFVFFACGVFPLVSRVGALLTFCVFMFSLKTNSERMLMWTSCMVQTELLVQWTAVSLARFDGREDHMWACMVGIAMLPAHPNLDVGSTNIARAVKCTAAVAAIVATGVCRMNGIGITQDVHGVDWTPATLATVNHILCGVLSCILLMGSVLADNLSSVFGSLLRARQELFAKVSHDLKQPVHSLVLLSDDVAANIAALARHKRVEAAAAVQQQQPSIEHVATNLTENVQDMRAVLETIKEQMQDFLLFSALSNIGGDNRNPNLQWIVKNEPFQLSSVCARVSTLVERQARAKGLQFSVKCATSLYRRRLLGDRMRLTQVLTNLCGNGVHYTEEGRVELMVEVVEEEDGAEPVKKGEEKEGKKGGRRGKVQGDTAASCIRFSVRDTGRGMTQEDCQSVFHPYTRVLPGGNSSNKSGSGLGLCISQGIVSVMGSSIQVESILGQGSCFYFTLRLGEVPSGPVLELQQLGGAPASPVTVLVRDDEERKDSKIIPWKLASPFTHTDDPELSPSPKQLFQVISAAALSELPRPVRLLLCEDQALIRKLFGRACRNRFGPRLEVVGCEDGRKGLRLYLEALESKEAIEEGRGGSRRSSSSSSNRRRSSPNSCSPFHVVCLDQHMPVMGGLATARAIQEAQREVPEKQRVLVVAISGEGGGEVERAAWRDAGVRHVLSKPFSVTQLAEVLKDGLPAQQAAALGLLGRP